MATMKMKKETKHTVVYETDDLTAAVASVYISKVWLLLQPRKSANETRWPATIELEVRLDAKEPA